MSLKILGLRESDERRLREGLEQLRFLNDSLAAKYSLRSDLRDLTDNRHTVAALLQEELRKISAHQRDLIKKTDDLSQLKLKLDESLVAIERIQEIVNEDEDGNSTYSQLLDLISKDKLYALESESEGVHQVYAQLFGESDEGTSKVDQIHNEIEEISAHYTNLFDDLNDSGETKVSEYERKINELSGYYDGLFLSDSSGDKSKSEQVNIQLTKIDRFYDKIYGNKDKDIKSLVDDLDNRLESLKNVEDRAKSVIGLSSEAGLAGGFVVKGKEAKNGQIISIVVFVFVILAIFSFNFYLFDKSDFLNMRWDAFLFKVLINAPLIWMATIANINLNRFSRLEQEYSHKEALAKSYERYKTEIQELEKLGVTGSEELKLRLLEINLEAFKLNPAKSSDNAKADFSIFSLIRNKPAISPAE